LIKVYSSLARSEGVVLFIASTEARHEAARVPRVPISLFFGSTR
jgi:hypothetical protein